MWISREGAKRPTCCFHDWLSRRSFRCTGTYQRRRHGYKDGMQNWRHKIGGADPSRLEGLGERCKLSQQSIAPAASLKTPVPTRCRIWSFGVKGCRHKYRRTPKIGDPWNSAHLGRETWVHDPKLNALRTSNFVVLWRKVNALIERNPQIGDRWSTAPLN